MSEDPPAFWDDATEAQQKAAIKRWWAMVNPMPDSDEYLILQMMSSADLGHGDPAEAEKELFARGLLELREDGRTWFAEKGQHVSWNLYEKATYESSILLAEPMPEGRKRYPPDGFFRTDVYAEPVTEPCTCKPDCPECCYGDCGCEACATRSEVKSHRSRSDEGK